ncbi:hypothetical protein LXL04_026621 [Taraxacum kok-saghyz]
MKSWLILGSFQDHPKDWEGGVQVRAAGFILDPSGVPRLAVMHCVWNPEHPNGPTPTRPQLTAELELRVQPAFVKGVRTKQGLAEQEATWEDMVKMDTQFPEFHLRDKVNLWTAGIDSTQQQQQAFKVYQRRARKQQQPNPQQP